MSTSDPSVLAQVVCQVLETAAFAFGEPCDRGELPAEVSGPLSAVIHFEGPACGTLTLATTGGLCRELAANLTAQEADEVTPEQSGDTLKEMANMTCGQWLTTAYGTAPVFRLTPPACQPLDDAGWQALAGRPGCAALCVEGHPVLASLVLAEGGRG